MRNLHETPRLLLVLPLVAGLHGCGRDTVDGATQSAVAPGRPGTGNPVEVVSPRPGSITESPGIGGSRGLIPPGVTGSGGPTYYPGQAQEASHPSQALPGVGLDGGLGAGASAASEPHATQARTTASAAARQTRDTGVD
jgi:hypothetical protein